MSLSKPPSTSKPTVNFRPVRINPSFDNGHTPFDDINLSKSPHLIHWGQLRFVMGVKQGWQSIKIGAGRFPLKHPEVEY